MNCPECQTENPTGARFCMNCGTSLALTCPNCGTSLPAGARFCFNCGHNLAAGTQPAGTQPAGAQPDATSGQPARTPTSDSAPPDSRLHQFIPKELLARLESASGTFEGERRVVTMLFCDVKDSTAAAGQLDPEEWAEIINHAFEQMIRPVYQFEGTVARLMGDGLLAFFGAPIAHEDDPQRAVLAGLEIVEGMQQYRQEVAQRWQIDLDVRVGINTGLVVVGAIGSDLRMEYTAMGDAINLAARMEQAAQPGTVQVTEATHKLIAPLFDFEALEPVVVKGKPEPVRAYRVVGTKAEPGRLRGIAGLDAPLIGRGPEMETLQTAIQALQRGRGQVVSIMGEAGLGKSRLLAELHQRVTADPERLLQWFEGRSLSYEAATPYAPFVDLFAAVLELQAGLPGEEQYAQLKHRVSSCLAEGSQAAEGSQVAEGSEAIAPFIAVLLGISPTGKDLERVKYLEPPFLRAQIFANVYAFFEKLASIQPLVLVFDDVHWIDPTSLELLESLLPLADRAAVMIVAAFRPHRQEPAWRFHETAARDYAHRYSLVSLEPLVEAASRELVGSLLHIEDLPEKVRRLILEKAEGNPFFVEEMIRSLLDDGLVVRENHHWRATRDIENISMPDTLVGVITARLDRLDENARQVAQAAAVTGREFAYPILAGILDRPAALEPGLDSLQRRELIREKRSGPQQTYMFKHVLTQEAAYASILMSRRRELHRRAAESLQKHQPEQVAGIARHFLEARQPGRAIPYLIEAGSRAARAYSSAEAIDFYSRALENQNVIEDRQLLRRAYEGLGNVLTFANQIPQAVENYQAMLRLAENQSDMSMRVSALNKLASLHALYMGQFQEAEQYLAQAGRLAREHEEKSGIVEMAIIRCQMCTAQADFDGVIAYMEDVVQIGREPDEKEHLSMGLEHVSESLMFLTRFDEAWQKAQEGLEVAREIGDREHEAWFLTTTIPICLICKGDLDEAQRMAEEGVQIAGRIGALAPQMYGYWLLGEIARWRGEYEQALEFGRRSMEASLPLEEFMPFMTVQPLGALGSTYLEISGHFTDQVAKLHRHALRLLETPAGAMGGGTAWADLGFCTLAIGDLESTEATFQKGLNYPTMFMLIEKPRYLLGLALVALARGQLDHARQLAEEAMAYAEERNMHHLYPLLALETGRIRLARGELDEARNQFERAEQLALGLKMRPVIWQARSGAAQALAASGQTAAAQAKQQAAEAMLAEIAGMFQDEDLRASFLSNAQRKIRS